MKVLTVMPDQRAGGKMLPAALGTYLTLGLQLALSVTVFFFVGRWLDGQFATAPWCTITGLLVGITGGFIKFFRTAIELGRQADQDARERKGQ